MRRIERKRGKASKS